MDLFPTKTRKILDPWHKALFTTSCFEIQCRIWKHFTNHHYSHKIRKWEKMWQSFEGWMIITFFLFSLSHFSDFKPSYFWSDCQQIFRTGKKTVSLKNGMAGACHFELSFTMFRSFSCVFPGNNFLRKETHWHFQKCKLSFFVVDDNSQVDISTWSWCCAMKEKKHLEVIIKYSNFNPNYKTICIPCTW